MDTTVRDALLAPVGADEHVPEATEVFPETKAGPRRATLAEIEEAAAQKRRDEDQRLARERNAQLNHAVAALVPRVDEWLDEMRKEGVMRKQMGFPYEDYPMFWEAVHKVSKTHRTDTHELSLDRGNERGKLEIAVRKRRPPPTVTSYVAPKPVETKESCVTM